MLRRKDDMLISKRFCMFFGNTVTVEIDNIKMFVASYLRTGYRYKPLE